MTPNTYDWGTFPQCTKATRARFLEAHRRSLNQYCSGVDFRHKDQSTSEPKSLE
jgi:hypothetical protein